MDHLLHGGHVGRADARGGEAAQFVVGAGAAHGRVAGVELHERFVCVAFALLRAELCRLFARLLVRWGGREDLGISYGSGDTGVRPR